MNSMQTKAKNYVKTNEGQCITQVVAIAEEKGLRIYVAWEREDMAKHGVYGIAKSRDLYTEITPEAIKDTANYGMEVSIPQAAKTVFKNLF